MVFVSAFCLGGRLADRLGRSGWNGILKLPFRPKKIAGHVDGDDMSESTAIRRDLHHLPGHDRSIASSISSTGKEVRLLPAARSDRQLSSSQAVGHY